MKACLNSWKPNISRQVGDVMSDVIASPSVRRLAGQKGVDLAKLARDLGRQTIAREDLDATPRPAAAAAAGCSYWDVDHSQYGPVTEEPMSRFAQVASRNLTAAQALIPAVTHHDQADISAVEAFRASLKPKALARGVKLTTLAFHVKALAQVLHEFPRFNASLSVDGETLILKNYIHIAVAVDTEFGLMVPVIRNADRKGLWQIAAEISDLAKRAQNRKVRPDEMGGASMTITNLGGIGGTAFTPIVNPPEVAILGITRTQIATIWDSDIPTPKPMAPLDLSYDHRVINGAEAARFMVRFTKLLTDPRRMLT
ncbi:putative dihydrolipoyllysine-residue acetyltransferase component of pyruvate dehydrogenase complex [Octadecabacter antarcticus 307]|uniref:Dihydrolipoyllysine-residue acetyltransferase component of pyruvate dehydrogenase complex n=2 Tax=Octadecabacter TaxID=53945 RepID=M9RF27_9RHOB|nr:putative dihydrolipoyllysine-residue acetyltransferase component of pyruvate dehydrogenase complex [Octadecabacter antarcticus 307]